MAVLVTPDPLYQTVYTTKSASNRGVVMAQADLNASGVTYAGGGVTCSFPVHNLWQVIIEHNVATASVLFFGYDYTNTKLKVFQPVGPSATSGILLGGEIASDTDISTLNAIRAFFIGND